MILSLEFFHEIWVRRSLSAAGYTVLIYDYFLTLNDEILYIWNAPWTIVKVLFLINRYGNLAGQTLVQLEEAGILVHSQFFCQRFTIVTSFIMIISSESIHILVLIRAWAIWGARRGMSNFLIGSYASYLLILLGISSFGAHHDSSENFQYLELAKVCASAMPKLMWLCYVGSFVLDAITFVLTAKSLRKYSREFQCLYPSDLFYLLFRDATMFFLFSMFNNATIFVSWTVYADSPYTFLSKGFSGPLLSVAGQRVVLNLKTLPTRTYATCDLSREVDRQLEALTELYHLSSRGQGVLDGPEGGRENEEM
ncbi:hypothetical protein BDR07DRAFT_771279 [Suillus spraguei]|nr:hypothetical protein BDR07DRAFT_771279 [Suillus spraguei]